jgi:hypothetical protein
VVAVDLHFQEAKVQVVLVVVVVQTIALQA